MRAQVKVWLGDTMEHHYILSRFLISRMLTVARVPITKVGPRSAARRLPQLLPTGPTHHACTPPRVLLLQATKIALDLKKHLVDHNMLEVKQVRACIGGRGTRCTHVPPTAHRLMPVAAAAACCRAAACAMALGPATCLLLRPLATLA